MLIAVNSKGLYVLIRRSDMSLCEISRAGPARYIVMASKGKADFVVLDLTVDLQPAEIIFEHLPCLVEVIAVFVVEAHHLELCISRATLSLLSHSSPACSTIRLLTLIDDSLYLKVGAIGIRHASQYLVFTLAVKEITTCHRRVCANKTCIIPCTQHVFIE